MTGTVGRSLELHFIDGKPDGMLTADVFDWTGHILMTPRTRIMVELGRPEAKFAGKIDMGGVDAANAEKALAYAHAD
jgi:hypothetical protein